MTTLKNRVQLIGNLGMNPEIVKFENGKKMAKLSVATSEVYYDSKGEKTEDVQWHNIVAWGSLAERTEKYLKKGSSIVIEGKLVYKIYEDKAGQKRYITEIIMSELFMLPKKN